MKPSDSIADASRPSLFQIAAFFEDLFPGSGFRPVSATGGELPIANLLANKDKLMSLLHFGNLGNASPPAPAIDRLPPKRANRTAPAKKTANRNINGQGVTPIPDALKKVEFTLEAPWAKSVKLAGDFTGWENRAVPMMHSPDGFWFTTVPLLPGEYSYRFIVDGQWYDDPQATHHTPNPFGSKNALIQVA